MAEGAFLLIHRMRSGVNTVNDKNYVYELTSDSPKLLNQPYSFFGADVTAGKHSWTLKTIYGTKLITHRGNRVWIRDKE